MYLYYRRNDYSDDDIFDVVIFCYILVDALVFHANELLTFWYFYFMECFPLVHIGLHSKTRDVLK